MGISKPSQDCAKHQKDMAVLSFLSVFSLVRNIKKIWLSYIFSSNQGRVSLSDELTSAKQDVELGQSHMDVTRSV